MPTDVRYTWNQYEISPLELDPRFRDNVLEIRGVVKGLDLPQAVVQDAIRGLGGAHACPSYFYPYYSLTLI